MFLNFKNQNNFDGVRIALALIVVFSHVSALTQVPDFKGFDVIFNSNFAVKGFFAISGFLVTKSYLSSRNIREYLEKRLRRIYPAYLVSIIFCLLIALFVTKLSSLEFIKSTTTLKYVFANLVFFNFIQPVLPTVFETNPTQALNGALWTIKVEVMLYFLVPGVIYFFKKFGQKKTTAFLFTISVIWVYFFEFLYSGTHAQELSRQFPGQLSYFSLGAFFSINEKALKNIMLIAFVSLIFLFLINNPLAKLIIDPIAYTSIVIFLSLDACKSLNLGKYGDISYGIYLYHFPIIQLLISLGAFRVNVWFGLMASLAVTLIFAFMSWHLIEKRFLKKALKGK
jgi:peptidoglycan/LPS O-acetylase OafA/YrhL